MSMIEGAVGLRLMLCEVKRLKGAWRAGSFSFSIGGWVRLAQYQRSKQKFSPRATGNPVIVDETPTSAMWASIT